MPQLYSTVNIYHEIDWKTGGRRHGDKHVEGTGQNLPSSSHDIICKKL